MAWDDDYAAPITTGALSGAAAGSIFGPPGAGIGAGLGAIGGYFSGKASAKRKRDMEKARRQTEELQRRQYAQRMQDMQRALGYFQPVNTRLERLYGSDAAPPPFVPSRGVY